MKRPSLAVHRYRHSSTHPYYRDLRAFGQGRKFFKTKGEAEAERMRQITLRERGGRAAVGLPLTELAMIAEARSDLAKYDKSIKDAATFYLDYLKRIARCGVTVTELAADVLAAKKKDGFGSLDLTDLRKRLNRFGRDFGAPIATITVEELDNWLRDLDCAPKTRANFRANVGVLFSYAEKRDMIGTNPIKRTSAPTLVDKAPEIFSVDELTALLNAAQSNSPDVVPMLRIAAFTGLRHSFASYRLAATNDAATVAAELGHSTSQMLYSTYREVLLPEEAERYWKIIPQGAEVENVVALTASAQSE